MRGGPVEEMTGGGETGALCGGGGRRGARAGASRSTHALAGSGAAGKLSRRDRGALVHARPAVELDESQFPLAQLAEPRSWPLDPCAAPRWSLPPSSPTAACRPRPGRSRRQRALPPRDPTPRAGCRPQTPRAGRREPRPRRSAKAPTRPCLGKWPARAKLVSQASRATVWGRGG